MKTTIILIVLILTATWQEMVAADLDTIWSKNLNEEVQWIDFILNDEYLFILKGYYKWSKLKVSDGEEIKEINFFPQVAPSYIIMKERKSIITSKFQVINLENFNVLDTFNVSDSSLIYYNNDTNLKYEGGGFYVKTLSANENTLIIWWDSRVTLPNQKIISIVKLIFYDLKDKKILNIISYNRSGTYPKDIKFTPDGKQIIVTFTDGKVEIWDGNTFKFLEMLTQQKYECGMIEFSNDGKYLALGIAHGYFTVWDFNSKQMLFQSDTLTENYYNYKFDKKGNLLYGMYTYPERNKKFKLLDLSTLKTKELTLNVEMINFIHPRAFSISINNDNLSSYSLLHPIIQNFKGLILFKYNSNSVPETSQNGNNIIDIIYPNPTNNTASVEIYNVFAQRIKITLNDINGIEIKVLQDTIFSSGSQIFTFDISNIVRGTYFIIIDYTSNDVKKIYKLVKE